MCPALLFDGLETNHLFAGFIQEAYAERFQALGDRQGINLKIGVGGVAFRQAIVRDLRAEVMDVVIADVAAEPAQDGRQLIVRATFQPGAQETPLVLPLPVRAHEVVLHVEEPDARARRKHDDGQRAEEYRLEPGNQPQDNDDAQHRKVGQPDVLRLALARISQGKSMNHGEHERRTDREQEKRVTKHPVADPANSWRRLVLFDGPGRHIADATAIEVARSGMMHGVVVSPMEIGRQRQHPQDHPHRLVRLP